MVRGRLAQLLAAHPMGRVADLRRLGATHGALQHARETGAVLRPVAGIYARPDMADDPRYDLAVACLATGGVIAGLSAARYHDLTDELPARLTVIVPRGYTDVPRGQPWDLWRSSAPAAFKLGVDTLYTTGLTPFRVTNPTRTLVDLYRMGAPRQHAVEALRGYLATGGSVGALRGFSRAFDRRHLPSLDTLWTDADAILATLERSPAP